jgi:hypothetical protein
LHIVKIIEEKQMQKRIDSMPITALQNGIKIAVSEFVEKFDNNKTIEEVGIYQVVYIR